MPPSSTEPYPFPELYAGHFQRYRAVEQHQSQLEELLSELRYEGLLLTEPANFAWFTAGGDWRVWEPTDQPRAALFLTNGHRLLLSTQHLAEELFEHEVPGLGFQLKVREGDDSFVELLDEVCRGRRVCSDSGFGRTRAVSDRIDSLRQLPFPPLDDEIRILARLTEEAIQQVCDSLSPGLTARTIAGRVSAACLERGLNVVGLLVRTDPTCQPQRGTLVVSEKLENWVSLELLTRQAGWHHAAQRNLLLTSEWSPGPAIWEQCQRAQGELVARFQAGRNQPDAKNIPTNTADVEYVAQQRVWQLGYRHPEQTLAPQTVEPLLPGRWYYLETRLGPCLCGGTYRSGVDELLPAWYSESEANMESISDWNTSHEEPAPERRTPPWKLMSHLSEKPVWVPECCIARKGQSCENV